MFLTNSVVFILINVFLQIHFVSSECNYVQLADQKNYVECTNVRSMQELAAEMRSNWNHLKIVNKVDSVFTNAEHHNAFLQYIQHLDLSKVGRFHTSDYGFRDYLRLNHLNISNTRTATLKDYWFSIGNQIEILDISWNQLTQLRRETFRTLHSLVTANFSHNEIENVEAAAFSDLKMLKHLDLRNNRLSYLNDWGELSSMETLNLDDNLLTKLSSNAFKGLIALQTLTVSQNYINDVERNCLSGFQKLQQINLSGNSMQTIPDHLFRAFSNIRLLELDFSNNDISSLPGNAFKSLNYLVALDLSRNAITSIDEYTFLGLNSLRRLSLVNNNISIVQPNTFATLNKLDSLDLSDNSLSNFRGDMFGPSSSLPKKLRKLLLKRNNLASIQPHAFDIVSNVDFLVLTDNSIRELREDLLLPLVKLKKLHINRNHIEALPAGLFNTTSLLQELYMDHNKLTFFPYTANSFANLAKITFEGNPWQCACFKEMLYWSIRRGINYSPYVSNKYYNGSRPVCVATPWNVCVQDVDESTKKEMIRIYETALSRGVTDFKIIPK